MNANELMINDWRIIDPTGEKVTLGITDNYSEGFICSDGDIYKRHETDPIPLTPEILEKNGFRKVNTQRWEFGEYESECYVMINPKKGYLYVNGKKNHCSIYDAPFVHTLQDALRLCGLNELADNWRI